MDKDTVSIRILFWWLILFCSTRGRREVAREDPAILSRRLPLRSLAWAFHQRAPIAETLRLPRRKATAAERCTYEKSVEVEKYRKREKKKSKKKETERQSSDLTLLGSAACWMTAKMDVYFSMKSREKSWKEADADILSLYQTRVYTVVPVFYIVLLLVLTTWVFICTTSLQPVELPYCFLPFFFN